MFVIGAVLYRLLFARLLYAPDDTKLKNSILIGFGLSLVLQTAALLAWTADERAVETAASGAVLPVGGVVVPVLRLASLGVAFAVLGGLHALLAEDAVGHGGPRDGGRRRSRRDRRDSRPARLPRRVRARQRARRRRGRARQRHRLGQPHRSA